MEIVENLYAQLHRHYRLTQYDYSKHWLKKGKGYFAYLQSSKSKANVDVLLGIYGEALKQKALWESTGKNKNGTDKAVYEQHTGFFENIVRTAENAIKKQALLM
jgi:hypothetical protein